MFDTLIESSAHSKDNKRASAFLLGTFVIYGTILLVVAVGTIIAMDVNLGDALSETTLLAPPPPPPAAAPPPAAEVVPTKTAPVNTAFVPPKKPEKIPDPTTVTSRPVVAVSTAGVPGGVPGGSIGGVAGGVIGGKGDDAPPPPPPPAPTPEPPKPTMQRISGGVLQGSAIRRIEPRYPPIAKTARAQGAVQVQVTISEDGRVIDAQVVSGHPLLREAAVQAARQWVFRPTELSGVPVKVQGILTFNFTLNQ